jgi:hypothetical protein
MANEVFANGREIACKAGSGKSPGCFPDVCFTPPDKTPATPLGVPIPYPNFAMASDTTEGSKSVKISGKEVMLRDKSNFKKSSGDEAAKPTTKKGLLTSVVQGKAYFASWSGDVKIEKENVVRHLDLTSHNHACVNPNALVIPYQDTQQPGKACPDYKLEAAAACSPPGTKPVRRKVRSGKNRGKLVPNGLNCDEKCKKAKTCVLVPKDKDKEQCCNPDTTGDHLIEDHMTAGAKDFTKKFQNKTPGLYGGAPCMCVNRSRYKGKHGVAHGVRGVIEDALIGQDLKYSKAKEMALLSFHLANPGHKCDLKCIESQLDDFYGPEEKNCNEPERKQPLKKRQRTDAKARVSQHTATPSAGGTT